MYKQKFNVALYENGKFHSVVAFGRSCKTEYSRGHAYKLAKDVREDKKFSGFSVYVESFGL